MAGLSIFTKGRARDPGAVVNPTQPAAAAAPAPAAVNPWLRATGLYNPGAILQYTNPNTGQLLQTAPSPASAPVQTFAVAGPAAPVPANTVIPLPAPRQETAPAVVAQVAEQPVAVPAANPTAAPAAVKDVAQAINLWNPIPMLPTLPTGAVGISQEQANSLPAASPVAQVQGISLPETAPGDAGPNPAGVVLPASDYIPHVPAQYAPTTFPVTVSGVAPRTLNSQEQATLDAPLSPTGPAVGVYTGPPIITPEVPTTTPTTTDTPGTVPVITPTATPTTTPTEQPSGTPSTTAGGNAGGDAGLLAAILSALGGSSGSNTPYDTGSSNTPYVVTVPQPDGQAVAGGNSVSPLLILLPLAAGGAGYLWWRKHHGGG